MTTTETLTLADFLLARIAEDEEIAKAADEARLWRVSQADDRIIADAGHMQRFTPSRVLAECEAKRRIIELHQIEVRRVSLPPFNAVTGKPNEPEYDVYCGICGWAGLDPVGGCDTLRLLALPYADHPDYRDEWRP